MKICNVVCDDEGSRCGNRKFENEVIVGIGKEWPPREEHLVMFSQKAKAVQNLANILRGEDWNKPGTKQNGLILENKCHRNSNLDVPSADRLEDLKAGALLGPETRHKD